MITFKQHIIEKVISLPGVGATIHVSPGKFEMEKLANNYLRAGMGFAMRGYFAKDNRDFLFWDVWSDWHVLVAKKHDGEHMLGRSFYVDGDANFIFYDLTKKFMPMAMSVDDAKEERKMQKKVMQVAKRRYPDAAHRLIKGGE